MSTSEHPFDDGFLSAAVREVRTEVHRQYAKLVDLVYRANRRAVALQHALAIHFDRPEQALGAALYARTLASTQATALLLEHGLPSQARTVLRAAIESLIPLCAIAKQPTVATAFIASHDADRRIVVDRIRRWKDPALRASIDSRISESEIEAMTKGSGKATNFYDLAKIADMEDWYLTLYTLLSFAAHTKVSDLDRHVVLDANGNAIEFQNEPDTSNQEAVWAWIAEVQLAAIRSVSALFSLTPEDIDSLSQNLREISEHYGA